ncbi:MAG: hypothetical protein HGA38_00745 [Candidatus Moranbacteria bacterium]|nr:hypothetical protein [Candidatus Moranbacteria bacterium]
METQNRTERNAAVVIMAGGSGTRLWPLSRKGRPKQFRSFISDKTLLEETYDRASLVVPKDRIFISGTEAYRDMILEILPGLGEDHLLLEPSPRGTGPAIGLIATMLGKRFPGITVATIASDHAIEGNAEFASSLGACIDLVTKNPKTLGILGINPTKPDTGLGYVRTGREITDSGSERAFFVDAFKEKPDRKTAETYLADWRYLWNAGYFVFRTDSMTDWLRDYAPELSEILTRIDGGAPLDETYAEAANEPIDTLLAERLPAESRIVVPTSIKWSDVGTWGSLFEFLVHRNNESSFRFGNAVELEGSGNLIYGNDTRTVTVFGVDDLVVVDTDDTVLVTSRERAGDIKSLIEELKRKGRDDLL